MQVLTYRGSALQSSIGKSRILLLFEFNIVPVPKSMILTESICVHIRTWNSDRSKFHAWQKFMAEWTHWNSSFEFGDRDRAHRNAGNLGIWYLNENGETKIVATLLISIRFQRGLVRPLGPTGSWNRFFGQIGTWRRRPPILMVFAIYRMCSMVDRDLAAWLCGPDRYSR